MATSADPVVINPSTEVAKNEIASPAAELDDQGPITKFPADDLRPTRRFITSHDNNGKGIFVVDDDGAHHRVMVRGKGVANIIYSTGSTPVDMNDDKDMIYARDNEVHINRPSFCL